MINNLNERALEFAGALCKFSNKDDAYREHEKIISDARSQAVDILDEAKVNAKLESERQKKIYEAGVYVNVPGKMRVTLYQGINSIITYLIYFFKSNR